MSGTEALKYLEKAKKIISVDFNSNDYLKDAEQAVCLLVEDGLMITFSHRSFQEYFAARFILDSKPEVQQKLMSKYSKTINQDNVMYLLYEMNSGLVERAFIIPHLEKLEELIGVKKKIGITHYLRFLKNEIAAVRFDEKGRFHTLNRQGQNRFTPIIRFALMTCGYLINFNEPLFLAGRAPTLDDKLTTVTASNLKSGDEIVRRIAASNSAYSMKRLNAALAVKSELVKKHQELDDSLDKVLGI